MLPDGTIPGSLTDLLVAFRSCFTAPTFTTFSVMVVGLVGQTRQRTVCGMLLGVGLQRCWRHARAHRFFATARWCADAVGLALLDLIVDRLLPTGSPITVVVDDTLFKRSGSRVFGVFWQHDGAAKGPKPIGFGNCWVVAGIVVDLPFLGRPVCLPVLARLWHPRRTGKLAHARATVELVAAQHTRTAASTPSATPPTTGCSSSTNVTWRPFSPSTPRITTGTVHIVDWTNDHRVLPRTS